MKARIAILTIGFTIALIRFASGPEGGSTLEPTVIAPSAFSAPAPIVARDDGSLTGAVTAPGVATFSIPADAGKPGPVAISGTEGNGFMHMTTDALPTRTAVQAIGGPQPLGRKTQASRSCPG